MREELRPIPYPEYRAITELMKAHYDLHKGQLRAIIAFGDLLTGNATFDIDLLEVIDDWEEPNLAVFANSADLPLRGQLRLYFLSSQEFESASLVSNETKKQPTANLLQRVRQGYEIILEDPPGYASRVLTYMDASGFAVSSHPLALQTRKSVTEP